MLQNACFIAQERAYLIRSDKLRPRK